MSTQTKPTEFASHISASPGSTSDFDADGPVLRAVRWRLWVAVALVLAVSGTAVASAVAILIAHNATEQSRRTFEQSSAEIASTLQLAIQREQDLVVTAAAYVVANPVATQAEFHTWTASLRMLDRYPEVFGLGYVVVVPAAQLPAFAVRAVANPVGPLAADGSFQVVPAGPRPYYCLGRLEQWRDSLRQSPAGSDYCVSDPAGLARSQTYAAGSYTPIQMGATAVLAIQIPAYAGGLVPSTVAGRLAAFQGWVGVALDPTVLLLRALQGRPDTALTFRYLQASPAVAFSSGTAPHPAQSTTIDLQNGWTVQVSGPVVHGGVLADRSALGVLLGGLALSVLLGAFVLTLGTGRSRALRQVEVRTGQLRHQALHDALTGLPNRTLIMDRIEQLLIRDRRQGTTCAALYVDLDEFKNVNDTLGHEAGDTLLTAVAARFKGTLRDADTIGRMGGDEFVVLIDGAALAAAPELVAERLLDVMRQPFQIAGALLPLIVTTSIGVALGDGGTAIELLRNADVALYQAKSAGKNRYAVFRPEMQVELTDRIDLESDLQTALLGDQFRLFYQPIYDLADLTLIAVEALLRWQHPTRGLLQPAEFIPLLEQSGQIRDVGRWVLARACAQTAAWHARGDTLDISVNVSPRQLDDDGLVDDVRDALRSSGLDPGLLIIEVAETALMRDIEPTARRMRAIKDLGVRIAVDNFGTGYSSLTHLRQFPIDCLKIDRAFTNAITSSPESRALIGTLVQLGRDMGLTTLAEGVETSGQMDVLRGENVNQAQGFLLARPLDPHTLETRILAPTRVARPETAPPAS